MPPHVAQDLFSHLVQKLGDESYATNLDSFVAKSLIAFTEVIIKHKEHVLLDLLAMDSEASPLYGIVLHGLPTDDSLGPCPTLGQKRDVEKNTLVSESILMAAGVLAGSKPVGYSFETSYSHPIVHNSCPQDVGSALSTNQDQGWHQDMGYLDQDLVPDFLGLVCLREGHDALVGTDLIDNRDVLQQLSKADVALLRRPLYMFTTPPWVSGIIPDTPKAIVSGSTEWPTIALPVKWDNLKPVSAEAQVAFENLKAAIRLSENSFMKSIHSVPGDLILFSQKRAIHRRSSYSDLRLDGYDRLLERVYFSKSIHKTIVTDGSTATSKATA